LVADQFAATVGEDRRMEKFKRPAQAEAVGSIISRYEKPKRKFWSRSLPVPSDAALYYPRIRIQEPNWLKMTLLCFGQVRRMIPLTYTPEDSDEVKECCETGGPNGLLVDCASLWAEPVQLELMRLRKKIETADEKATYRFTRKGYLENAQNPKLADSFEIHRMKIEPLVQTLLDRKLAWTVDKPRGENWLAVHPELGEVIMTILAIAVAKFDGLSIVTPSRRAHGIATSLEDQLVLEELLGSVPKVPSDNAGDLIQVVMQSVLYDVSKLTIKQIADLLEKKEDLISLRGALEVAASRIPPMENPDRRSQLVREAAIEAVHEWQKENSSALAKMTKGVEISDGVYEIGEAVVELHFIKAAFKTVTFLFKLVSGEKDRDQARNRYKFLNLVEQKVNPNNSWLMLPAFGKLA